MFLMKSWRQVKVEFGVESDSKAQEVQAKFGVNSLNYLIFTVSLDVVRSLDQAYISLCYARGKTCMYNLLYKTGFGEAEVAAKFFDAASSIIKFLECVIS